MAILILLREVKYMLNSITLSSVCPRAEVVQRSAGRSPPSSWLAGRVLWVPARMGQPQASRDLNFCDQELSVLAKMLVVMCPGKLAENQQILFLFFLGTPGNFVPSYARIGALITWKNTRHWLFIFVECLCILKSTYSQPVIRF